MSHGSHTISPPGFRSQEADSGSQARRGRYRSPGPKGPIQIARPNRPTRIARPEAADSDRQAQSGRLGSPGPTGRHTGCRGDEVPRLPCLSPIPEARRVDTIIISPGIISPGIVSRGIASRGIFLPTVQAEGFFATRPWISMIGGPAPGAVGTMLGQLLYRLGHLEVITHRDQFLTDRGNRLVDQRIDTRYRRVDLGLADFKLIPMRFGWAMCR
jgi:hypothetical protein